MSMDWMLQLYSVWSSFLLEVVCAFKFIIIIIIIIIIIHLKERESEGKVTFMSLDFKLSPCTECCMLSFGWIPGVWNLYADVSEHSVCAIFIGR